MTDSPAWVPVLLLFGLLGLAYLAMWRGWRRRARKHDLPALVPVGAAQGAALTASGRYVGSTLEGQWLDRVVARGLGRRSGCRLVLAAGGLDVHRPRDAFRIPREALRGARLESGLAGKVVPPHGLLVVTWQQGDLVLDSGFRLDALLVPGEPSKRRRPREIHQVLMDRILAEVTDTA